MRVTNSSLLAFNTGGGANEMSLNSSGTLKLTNNGPPKLVLNNTAATEWIIRVTNGSAFAWNTGGGANEMSLDTGGNLTTAGLVNGVSSREVKENITAVDGRQVLAGLEELPIATWNYKTGSPEARHMGPVAEDFFAAFGLGADDRHIAPYDVAGVALAAIKAQQAEISALRDQVSALEELVSRLLDGRG